MEAGFHRTHDGWMVYGRQEMETAAEEVQVSQGRAVRGVAEIGYFSRGASYEGSLSEPRAVVVFGESAMILRGGRATEDLITTILPSSSAYPPGPN